VKKFPEKYQKLEKISTNKNGPTIPNERREKHPPIKMVHNDQSLATNQGWKRV